MVTVLMMSLKMDTPGHDVIMYIRDIINKILSRYSDYIVDVVMS